MWTLGTTTRDRHGTSPARGRRGGSRSPAPLFHHAYAPTSSPANDGPGAARLHHDGDRRRPRHSDLARRARPRPQRTADEDARAVHASGPAPSFGDRTAGRDRVPGRGCPGTVARLGLVDDPDAADGFDLVREGGPVVDSSASETLCARDGALGVEGGARRVGRASGERGDPSGGVLASVHASLGAFVGVSGVLGTRSSLGVHVVGHGRGRDPGGRSVLHPGRNVGVGLARVGAVLQPRGEQRASRSRDLCVRPRAHRCPVRAGERQLLRLRGRNRRTRHGGVSRRALLLCGRRRDAVRACTGDVPRGWTTPLRRRTGRASGLAPPTCGGPAGCAGNDGVAAHVQAAGRYLRLLRRVGRTRARGLAGALGADHDIDVDVGAGRPLGRVRAGEWLQSGFAFPLPRERAPRVCRVTDRGTGRGMSGWMSGDSLGFLLECLGCCCVWDGRHACTRVCVCDPFTSRLPLAPLTP